MMLILPNHLIPFICYQLVLVLAGEKADCSEFERKGTVPLSIDYLMFFVYVMDF